MIGTHSCFEAIKVRPQWVDEVNILEGQHRDNESIIDLCKKKKIPLKEKGKKFFNTLPGGHQGVLVKMNNSPQWSEECAQKEESLVVFLDGIEDPHNLGSILRTSWLLGVDGIFIPKNRRVDLTPVVCKVASGGVEHVPVESCHFGSQLEWFKEQGYWIYGLKEQGDVLLPQQNAARKSVLIVGSEGSGIRSSTENFCDQFFIIPQVEGGSSYNASVAFALSAYEMTRSRYL